MPSFFLNIREKQKQKGVTVKNLTQNETERLQNGENAHAVECATGGIGGALGFCRKEKTQNSLGSIKLIK